MAEKIPIFNDPVQLQVREHVLKLEKKEINQSKKQIQHLNSDINTIRRQIEIIEDHSLRQNNGLFLLKLSITYLSLILLPILLAMKNIIAWTFFKIYVVGLTVLVGIIAFFNLRSIWKRNYNRFSLRNFDADPPKKEEKKVEKFTNNQTDIQNKVVEMQVENMTDNDKMTEHFKPVESSLAFRNRL